MARKQTLVKYETPSVIPDDESIMKLSREGQRCFANALLNSRPPAAAMKRAFMAHKELIDSRQGDSWADCGILE